MGFNPSEEGKRKRHRELVENENWGVGEVAILNRVIKLSSLRVTFEYRRKRE
jgi:hypothetical protein